MRRLPYILIAAVSLLALWSCRSTPGYVIPKEKMARLLADVHTGEAVVESNHGSFRTDSAKRVFLQSIYDRHGVSQEQVDTSFYWYGNNLKEYMEVYDRTIEIIEERIADAEKTGAKSDNRLNQMSVEGDSVNIWTESPTLRVTPENPSHFIAFNFSNDKNWERGDRYTLRAKLYNTRSRMHMALAVNYSDGSIEYVQTTSTPGSDRCALTLVLDSAKSASNVYGSLHYAPFTNEISYLDSITLVRTRGRNDNVRARASQNVIK